MNNPSTEQIEAARAEYDRSEDMCAALVAAAGATPQEPVGRSSGQTAETAHRPVHFECDCVPNLGPPHCHACGDEVGNPVYWSTCPLATPPQVDEAKLAEVLVRSLTYSTGLDAEVNDAIAAVQANAVAEWLRGGGQ